MDFVTVVSVEEFRAHLDQYLEATVQGEVVLTRGGKPIAILHALPENGDQDSDPFVGSDEFWRMIRLRRQEQGIPWEEARKQLDLGE
jgi:antitoxin (DNA-binding transcriptional repressor) of toxin-antitoxin stability system